MFIRTLAAGLAVTAGTVVGAVSLTASPVAAEPLDPVDVTFPAGQVCSFALRVEGTGGDQVVKSFPGRDGDQITTSVGTGYDLTFTNVDNNQSVSLPSRFSATTTVTHLDGSKTVYLVGWNVLFLFPTDVPAGPSTTLHVGLVVYDDDGFANFVVDQRRTRSHTRDICGAVD